VEARRSVFDGLMGLGGREAAQLRMLVSSVRLSVIAPFQRLPGPWAVFLAEAVAALLHPTSALYPSLNRLLLTSPRFDLTVCHPPPAPHLTVEIIQLPPEMPIPPSLLSLWPYS
jgi:Nucleolar pre-ribosomal-associated protein 1